MIKSRSGEDIDTEAVKKFNEDAADWTGTCRRCKVQLVGTLAQMRGHVCDKS